MHALLQDVFLRLNKYICDQNIRFSSYLWQGDVMHEVVLHSLV